MLRAQRLMLNHPQAVSHATARVLMVVAYYANDDGTGAKPSLVEIEADSQASLQTIRAAFLELERLRFVHRTPGGGKGITTQYTILFPATWLGEPKVPTEQTITSNGYLQ